MQQVYLGLGSNIEPERHLVDGVNELRAMFGALVTSSVYRSAAVGFDGAAFLNLVVGLRTDLALGELSDVLRCLEFLYGRERNAVKFSSRRLDIDILTYADYRGDFNGIVLPRSEISKNAFVLCPFAELAPELVLPGQQVTLRDLWHRYTNPSQRLTRVTAAITE